MTHTSADVQRITLNASSLPEIHERGVHALLAFGTRITRHVLNASSQPEIHERGAHALFAFGTRNTRHVMPVHTDMDDDDW